MKRGSPKRSLARVGDQFVNFYLLEERPRLALIDGGLPAHLDGLEPALESRGRDREDFLTPDGVLGSACHDG